jgi:hypothetical protein
MLAGHIVGNGERRMENGIAGFAAGEPDIAHCGHLRLRSRAQQHSIVYDFASDYGSTSRAGATEECY